jgi:hypothetical protein
MYYSCNLINSALVVVIAACLAVLTSVVAVSVVIIDVFIIFTVMVVAVFIVTVVVAFVFVAVFFFTTVVASLSSLSSWSPSPSSRS